MRLLHIQNNLLHDASDDGLELLGETKNGGERRILWEGTLWKCKSKRKLVGLLLTDMILILEASSAGRYSLYVQVRLVPCSPMIQPLASALGPDTFAQCKL